MDAAEEVLLDVNVGAEGHAFYSVQGFKVSPNHKTFGYAVDTVGRRFYDIHFVDIETGEELDDTFEAVTPNFVWAADNKTVFFVKQDPQTLRWHRIYRHELGSDPDELVYEEADETYSTFVYQGMSGAYIYIYSGSTIATEVRLIPADAPASDPTLFLPRRDHHEYRVIDGADRFYVMSNDGAKNFQIPY
jgi:oligopeptidase B